MMSSFVKAFTGASATAGNAALLPVLAAVAGIAGLFPTAHHLFEVAVLDLTGRLSLPVVAGVVAGRGGLPIARVLRHDRSPLGPEVYVAVDACSRLRSVP